MAVTDWPMNWNSTYLTTATSGAAYMWTPPITVSSGSYSNPAPRPQTALEWLDAEIEATCKLARQAG